MVSQVANHNRTAGSRPLLWKIRSNTKEAPFLFGEGWKNGLIQIESADDKILIKFITRRGDLLTTFFPANRTAKLRTEKLKFIIIEDGQRTVKASELVAEKGAEYLESALEELFWAASLAGI